TYAKAGRQAEAQDTLQKVLAANPKSVTDLQLAGELSLSSDAGTALQLLKRAEALQPSARSELLIARAYQRLNQPQESKQYFDHAEAFLKRAEAHDTNNYRLHAIRGQIASMQGRNEDSVREYQAALAHLPEGVPEGPLYPVSLHLSLYQLYQATGQPAPAEGEL